MKLMKILFSLSFLTSCMTFKAEKEMRDDIFKLQTRLLEVEGNLEKDQEGMSQKTTTATRGVASVSASVDALEREIQRLKGEVDTLKYALSNGSMPGGGDENEQSIFSKVTTIEERIGKIEQTQKDILDLVSKKKFSSNSKKAGSKYALKNQNGLATLSQARKAFKDRKYAYLKRDVPELRKKMTKKSSVFELDYMYAESLFKLGSIKDAVLKYNDLIDSNPPSKYLLPAKMRMGDCYRYLGEAEMATIYYEEVVAEYPKSNEAAKAKERLVGLKKKLNKRG